MNKRILSSLLVLGLASTGLGYGTFAYFTDEETSTDNIFTAATLNLQTDDADGVTGTISAANFAPGDTTSGSVVLKNAGSLTTGVDLDLKAVMAYTDDTAAAEGGACAAGDEMDKNIEITALSYGATDLLAQITDADADGIKSLDDLEAHGVFADLADPGAAGTTFSISVSFHTSAPNCNQADSVDMTLTFALQQVDATDLA